MVFTTDQQTLDDLKIFSRNSGDSIYGIFNKTFTRGGSALLEEMFRYPFSDSEIINTRLATFQFFAKIKTFPFDTAQIDIAEQYLQNVDERTKISADGDRTANRLSNLVLDDVNYKFIQRGVAALISLLKALCDFMGDLDTEHAPHQKELADVLNILGEEDLGSLLEVSAQERFSYARLSEYDLMLRFKNRLELKKVLLYIYHLDVYVSVAKVAATEGFCYPRALVAGAGILNLEGLYHPKLVHPITNDLHLDESKSVLFLTGANMAGKSTFMKSLGVALFLAHMGFPVPASSMEFSVMDGIFTTINLPDNLSVGNSHFYAEVLRVKKIAKELSLSRRLFVIIDELFRGTNVKDAYEATILITEAFARRKGSIFVISTHIIEAGEVLKESCGNVDFKYLPTVMSGNTPIYTRKLKSGITADRHGMLIINNEGILEILKNGKIT
ncbi:MutS domain III [Pedobacter sp. ok626]|uniref:MutS-related protein n=1 Tax=Pedobacter sp. ok626 TaxID=1761882 RepID=UPI000891B484|nr:DNA mismatch repair protein [Pedobacter sp. ok626]SDL10360.1 MutS domain III [Pedobacter sp. ok626]